MPLQKQTIPIPIGAAGIDTRVDPKVLPSPALAVAENVSFATPGRLAKRTGMANPGSAITADAVASVGDTLVRFTRAGASLYDSTAQSFATVQGPTSMGVEYLLDSGNAFYPFAFDACRAGGWDYLAASVYNSGVATEKLAVCGRHVTDGHVLTSTSTSTNARSPRVVTVGSNAYALYTAGTNILFAPLTNGTIGAETTVASNLNATFKAIDVAVTGSQILLAYVNTGGDIISGYVSTSGVLGGTQTNTPAAAVTALGVAAVSGGNYGIIWGMSSVQDVVARLYDSGGTAIAAAQTIDSATGANIDRVVGCFDTAGTTLHVFYGVTNAANVNWFTRRGSINTSSVVVAGALFYRHSTVLSKPWLVVHGGADHFYITLGHNSAAASGFGVQGGAIVVKYTASGNQVVGCLFSGSAYGFAGATTPGYGWMDSHTPSAQQYAPGAVLVPIWIRRETANYTLDNATVKLVALTLNHADAFANVNVGNQLHVAGAQLELLSPRTATAGVSSSGNCEAAPIFYPQNITLTPSNSTGTLTSGATYQYRFYWETYDGNGAVIRTSYIGSQSVTLGGADDTVTATIHTLAHTNCNTTTRPMWLGAYRAVAGGSTIFYRVSRNPSSPAGGSNGFILNDASADAITFVDELSDANLTSREQDYQSSDPVELDNIAPPPHKVIAAGNDRVFLAGMEDPNLIWVSKLRTSGEALAFNDALTISIDAGDGPIAGMVTMADNLVVFRERQIYLVGGDGPNNVGLGGEFTPSRIVSEDVGCTEQRSICRIPTGVLFKSAKGIYLLGNDFSLTYVGAPVEDYNSEAITSAVALTTSHEVRFTTASRTMIYDYLANAWGTWTIPAIHGCLWRGQWVALDNTGILIPTAAYTDRGAAYTMAIETGWIKVGALQNFMRLWKIIFLGSYEGPHKIRVKLAFDYNVDGSGNPAWADDDTWEPDDFIGQTVEGVTSRVYQFQVRPSESRIEAVKIRVEDAAPAVGSLGNSFTLSEILLEVGLRGDGMKLGPSQTL